MNRKPVQQRRYDHQHTKTTETATKNKHSQMNITFESPTYLFLSSFGDAVSQRQAIKL